MTTPNQTISTLYNQERARRGQPAVKPQTIKRYISGELNANRGYEDGSPPQFQRFLAKYLYQRV